ncbi:MAG: hypothetical protein IJT41_03420, partial [Clostridia bacterium]|nr:hypothetical protein [Clostridia bacterium]
MLKNICKRTLATLIAIVMIVTTFCFADLGLFANAWVNVEKIKTAGRPTVQFYVPETIYRNPSGTGYQYFVDSSKYGTLSTDAAKTSGTIAFTSDSLFTSLTITRSDDASKTYTASNKSTYETTFSDGDLAGSGSGNNSVITWTATYQVDGRWFKSVAHTYVYEPDITQSGTAWHNYYSGDWSDPECTFFFFLTGYHSKTGGDMCSNFTERGANSALAAPLVKFPAGSWTATGTGRDSNIIPSSGSNSYFTEQENGGVTRKWMGDYHDIIWPTGSSGSVAGTSPQVATITVDTSRYSSYSQIPNFKVGYSQYYMHRYGSGNHIYWIKSAANFTDSDAEDAEVSGTPNLEAINVDTGSVEADNMMHRGLYSLSGTLPQAGSSRTDTIYVKRMNGFKGVVRESTYAIVGTSLTTVAVSKGALRDVYRQASCLAVDTSSSTATPSYSNYSAFTTSLINAGKVLGDPTAAQSTIDSAKSDLQTKLTNLKNQLTNLPGGFQGVPITFYVPELIYLKPNTTNTTNMSTMNSMSTFQYYVDRNTAANGFGLRTGENTTGNIYFKCDQASKVKSITCSGANVSLSTSSSDTNTLECTINSGTMSSAVAHDSQATLTWTITYTVGGVDFTAKSYTRVYAPYSWAVA